MILRKSPDTRDGITVTLVGGLGNQIFGYAAGLEQAKRLDCPLYLDVSSYRMRGSRNFALDIFSHNAEIVENMWPENLRTIFSQSRHSIFKEASFEFDASINEVKIGTTLFGYFQSPKYFPNVTSIIANSIGNPIISSDESVFLQHISNLKYVALHVRRGDYLGQHALPHHGLVDANYFSRALQILGNQYQNMEKHLFSDSPELALEELNSIPAVQLAPEIKGLHPGVVLKQMSLATALVISNSTFSWWSAWIAQQNQEIPVIAPRNWFAGRAAPLDLFPNSWILLG